MGGAIPRTGASLGGAPLSLSRTPTAALADHIARFFVTIIERPADALLDDFLLHENAYVRVPVVGTWETLIDDRWVGYEGPMLFGAQERRFAVRCRGPIIAAGFMIRPSAWFSFCDESADQMADRLLPIGGDWGAALRWATQDIYDHEQTFARLEQVVLERVIVRATPTDPVSATFERDRARSIPSVPLLRSQRRSACRGGDSIAPCARISGICRRRCCAAVGSSIWQR
ncbi:hypothetical protein QP166_14345 [Sphingomonas sp. LR60]|uniref:hypothetical protein n=1 Tax=Sphingomonas sp. LR60 TaxID=3050233 RepID=UPI002FE32D10